MAKNSDNCFLFLGKTGVGKSLCAKNLTSNRSIKVSDKAESCTTEIRGYNACIPSTYNSKELKYRVIDTPGLCDSKGKDNGIINQIEAYLKDKDMKVKGIFIFLNFRNVRFDNSEKDIIKKIYNLVPFNNFWDYVTIIFTNCYADKFENLEEKKKEKSKSFRKSFEPLINNSYDEELIIKIRTENLRIEYIDLYDLDNYPDPNIKENVRNENKKYLDSLKNIFRELSKKDPLYSKIKTDKYPTEQKVISRILDGKADLYKCKILKTYYYNQKGDIIKEKGKIVEKVFEKQIILDRYKEESERSFFASLGAYIASAACFVGGFVFPPAAPALFTAGGVLYTTGIAAGATSLGTTISNSVENETYYKTDDISKYQ